MLVRIGCLWALALVGCAVVPTGAERVAQGKRQLEAAKSCCTKLDEARRLALPPAAVTLIIDDKQQAFDFGSGKSFFVLYELPPFERTYSVTITSVPAGPIADMALFVPHVALYDGEFRRTRFFDETTLRNRGNNLERTVFVNPQNTNEKFLLVSGSALDSEIETPYSIVTSTPVVAGPFVVNMLSGQDGKTKLRTAPTGQLEIEVGGLVKRDAK